MIKVTFFGVRGSTPCSGPQMQVYGGHTSCVTIEIDNQIFICDAGSGIFDASTMVLEKYPKESHLLLSHGHLDHVMGLPFFKPIWDKNHTLNIYAGTFHNVGGVKSFLTKAFRPPLFPVPFERFASHAHFTDFTPGDRVKINNFLIETHSLNHPNGAVGYRFDHKGMSVCYITDHEHTPGVVDHELLNFIKGTDLFIYDASYDDVGFEKCKGWGHSTWQEALRLGKMACVKHTVLFHHDPLSNDETMHNIEAQAKILDPTCIVSRQGMVIDLPIK
jgi:phosphoribosyl 1,2-cyclic phosphodiesterase